MTAAATLAAEYRALLDGDTPLGAHHFTSGDVFEAEHRGIFLRTWVCVAVSADAPADGDLFPLDFVGMPLLLARQRSTLRLFHNVCSHRGLLLVDAPARGRIRITCPYHAWTYDLSGALTQTPHVGGDGRHTCPTIDTTRLGLREVRVVEWCGHVFADFSGLAPEFADWIRPVAERLVDLHTVPLARDPGLDASFDLAVNWKIIVENFAESYHLPFVHRALNRASPMGSHYQILGGLSYMGQGSVGFAGGEDVSGGLPLLTPRMDRSRYESLYVFPNVMLLPFPDMMFSILLLPRAADRTEQRLNLFVAGAEALDDRYAARRKGSADFALELSREDFAILDRLQAGRRSPAFERGVFAPMHETSSLQFQKMVAVYMLAGADGAVSEAARRLPYRDIAHG